MTDDTNRAHAKRVYYCSCGRIVHGNGGRAMHFYVAGHRILGLRAGHRPVSNPDTLAIRADGQTSGGAA